MDVFFMLLLIISFLCHPSSLLGNGESTTLAARTHRKHDLIHSLPGLPKQRPGFKQYGGYVTVDVSKGRSLYYYFAEAATKPDSKPLILWLNGGPGCSSLLGAMVEIGPFGVNPDGKSLYQRRFAWNKGHYIPELVDVILQKNMESNLTFKIQVKGIMIGNGLLNDETDTRGINDFLWSHALISDEAYHGYAQFDIGKLDPYDIYAPVCNSSLGTKRCMDFDPCESDYIHSYFNLPAVQKALHANKTKLPYTWEVCSSMVGMNWRNGPSSMFPIYRRLMASGLRILLYSGDVDSIIPVTSTRYSIAAMGLKVKKPWVPWYAGDSNEVAGYRVIYDGLSFATVRGAGHLVPQSKPSRAFALLKKFIAADDI
ncbi:hypothetical protein DH2020_029458 [Rehmannia glutinosa]|uniref:Serine carboxypeptidase-like protein n=1 Tax=Rehmannia glutinosa TaxID=99300 RepID=A0ABR0VQ80_REHGL